MIEAPFSEQIRRFSTSDLTRAFPGITMATVYGWRCGSRKPPAWLQKHVIATLEARKQAQK